MYHLTLLVALCATVLSTAAAETGPAPTTELEHVYTYPVLVTPDDVLRDGPDRVIPIKEPSMFIWVDLMPEARFVHPTLYVLIGAHGVRLAKGAWWPELNKRRILYGQPANHTIMSPFTVQDADAGTARQVHVYIHPLTLTPRDRLQDGPRGEPIPLEGETQLIWVDLLPDADFAHPTQYLLINGTRTRVVKGQWTPILNGRRILYGEPATYTIASPFIKRRSPLMEAISARLPEEAAAPAGLSAQTHD